jgi:hypothetical protein
MRRFVTTASILAVVSFATPSRAETVLVPSDRDTTLIEDPGGAFSNGAGPVLFAGRTNQGAGSVRRGLLRFDLAGALPRGAVVESVTLRLTALPGNPGASRFRLYRVLADWGEGASFATGGRGAPSESGDATWIHTFYDDRFWEYAGGQFVGTASAEFEVEGAGTYVVSDDRKLLADTRLFAAAPSRNFGWILIGDETRPQTVQPFATREADDPGQVPVLEISFRRAGEPRAR